MRQVLLALGLYQAVTALLEQSPAVKQHPQVPRILTAGAAPPPRLVPPRAPVTSPSPGPILPEAVAGRDTALASREARCYAPHRWVLQQHGSSISDPQQKLSSMQQ